MTGATVGILSYTKGIYHQGLASAFAPSMFTVRGNALAPRIVQSAPVTNYDNGHQVVSSRIHPLSHGIPLPQIPLQGSLPGIQESRPSNKSEVWNNTMPNMALEVDRTKLSAFPNFRILEQDGNRTSDIGPTSHLAENKCNAEKYSNNKQQMNSSYRASSDYKCLLKDELTNLSLKTKSNDIHIYEKDSKTFPVRTHSTKVIQTKKKSKFHKNSARKSRCKNKRGKRKIQLNDQEAIRSYGLTSSKQSSPQVRKIPKSKTNGSSGDTDEISPTSSSTNSISSSHTSLCSEVFQRASTIYRNLKNTCEEKGKIRRVYLSEKQSGVIKDCGVSLPCAPPSTPNVEQLNKIEYILSMNDIRSQRAVKERLSQIENKVKRKELARKQEAKRSQKQHLKDQEVLKKQRQRLEIYALNKIMTDLEEKNFQQFCRIMNNGLENSSETKDKAN